MWVSYQAPGSVSCPSCIPTSLRPEREHGGSLAIAQTGAQEERPEAASGGSVGRSWGQPCAVCVGSGGPAREYSRAEPCRGQNNSWGTGAVQPKSLVSSRRITNPLVL